MPIFLSTVPDCMIWIFFFRSSNSSSSNSLLALWLVRSDAVWGCIPERNQPSFSLNLPRAIHETRYCPLLSYPLHWWNTSFRLSCILSWREILCMSFLNERWNPSLGHTNWSTLWQAHNNAQLESDCPWWPTHCSSFLCHKKNNYLWHPYRPFVCSVLGPRLFKVEPSWHPINTMVQSESTT